MHIVTHQRVRRWTNFSQCSSSSSHDHVKNHLRCLERLCLERQKTNDWRHYQQMTSSDQVVSSTDVTNQHRLNWQTNSSSHQKLHERQEHWRTRRSNKSARICVDSWRSLIWNKSFFCWLKIHLRWDKREENKSNNFSRAHFTRRDD